MSRMALEPSVPASKGSLESSTSFPLRLSYMQSPNLVPIQTRESLSHSTHSTTGRGRFFSSMRLTRPFSQRKSPSPLVPSHQLSSPAGTISETRLLSLIPSRTLAKPESGTYFTNSSFFSSVPRSSSPSPCQWPKKQKGCPSMVASSRRPPELSYMKDFVRVQTRYLQGAICSISSTEWIPGRSTRRKQLAFLSKREMPSELQAHTVPSQSVNTRLTLLLCTVFPSSLP